MSMGLRQGLGLGVRRTGGGAAPFDPSFNGDATGLRRWHNGASLTADASAVALWTNEAPGIPSASNYVQATAGRRLTVATTAGYKYLLSRTTDTYLETDIGYSNLTDTWSWALIKVDSGSPTTNQILFSDVSTRRVGLNTFNAGAGTANFTVSKDPAIWGGNLASVAVTLTAGQWIVVELRLAGTSLGGNSYVAINGVIPAGGTTTTTNGASEVFRRLMADVATNAPFYGGLQALGVYDATNPPTSDQRAAIYSELAARATAMNA
jgi:hypothetical protein